MSFLYNNFPSFYIQNYTKQVYDCVFCREYRALS
nr:MAG TPA: hypothetical protein [Caudoviricetes sp.]